MSKIAVSVDSKGLFVLADTETGDQIKLNISGVRSLIAALMKRLPFQYQAISCQWCSNGAFTRITPGGSKWCCAGCGRDMLPRGS